MDGLGITKSCKNLTCTSLISRILTSSGIGKVCMTVAATSKAAPSTRLHLHPPFHHFKLHYCICIHSPSRSRTLTSSLQRPDLRPFSYQDMASINRWLRPEVYPLFVAVGVAVGICGLQLVRNICINPEVRVSKEKRSAGVLENFSEGEKYAEHFLRKYVRNKTPEIMPSINSFFTDPERS